MDRHAGGCHCQNLSYVWNTGGATLQPRRCACSFCTKHGITWASQPDSALSVHIKASELLARYTFASRSCEFYVCLRCGTVPLGLTQIAARRYAVVNINTFDSRLEMNEKIPTRSFDGEKFIDRQARRQANWIRDVSINVLKAPAPAHRHPPDAF